MIYHSPGESFTISPSLFFLHLTHSFCTSAFPVAFVAHDKMTGSHGFPDGDKRWHSFILVFPLFFPPNHLIAHLASVSAFVMLCVYMTMCVCLCALCVVRLVGRKWETGFGGRSPHIYIYYIIYIVHKRAGGTPSITHTHTHSIP